MVNLRKKRAKDGEKKRPAGLIRAAFFDQSFLLGEERAKE